MVIISPVQDVSCNGGSDGSAIAFAFGGIPPYTYLWSSNETTETAVNLTAGVNTITVTDLEGETVVESVFITEPDAIEISIDQTNVDCNGNNTGAATANPIGGVGDYSYEWSNGDDSPSISNLYVGTYTVVITDENNCSNSESVIISEPELLSCNIFGINIACNGSSDGEADLTVIGGTPSYTYLWNTGATTEDLTGLTTGTYTVTITDANGCTTSCDVTISEPELLFCSIIGINITCNGSSEGEADLTVMGGTPSYTYLWNTGATSEDLTGLIAGTYIVTITDINFCTTSCSVIITEPPVLELSLSATDETSNGANDGTATANPAGGSPGYTYLWNNGATTQMITGLIAGQYCVTVTDQNGCTIDGCVMVEGVNCDLSGEVLTTDASCHGGQDGKATAIVTGGTAPFTFIWSVGGTGQTITNLPAGNHSVTITDVEDCSIVVNFTIAEPDPITITGDITNNICNGDCNGSIDITINGGTPAYTYFWTGPTLFVETTEDINLLCAEDYSVMVTDAEGCTASASFSVEQPAPILIEIDNNFEILCHGSCDGAINISPSGGTPGYMFAWTGPGGFTETTEDISMRCIGGNYVVIVTDSKACSATKTEYLNVEPDPIIIEIDSITATCSEICDGSISITVSGGTPGYLYAWTGPNFTATTADISMLCPGPYELIVTDNHACTSAAVYTVEELIQVTAEITPTTCNEFCDGSIDITVSGGTAPYTYTWSGPDGFTASLEDISGLCGGAYKVIVVDSEGCVKDITYTLEQPDPLTVVGNVKHISCIGACDGSIDITVNGGTPPYSYQWIGPGSFSANTEDISDLCFVPFFASNPITPTAFYALRVTDNNGCIVERPYYIAVYQHLFIRSKKVLNNTCNGACNGRIDITVYSGTPPYSYQWVGPGPYTADTEDISSLCAGNYEVVVTDSEGCRTSKAFNVADSPISISAYERPQPNCGKCNGNIKIFIDGGTPPYSSQWFGPEGYTAQQNNISGLCVGNYTVVVTDSEGCTSSKTFSINNYDLYINSDINDTSCDGACDGQIHISASNGTPPYTYKWVGPGGFTATTKKITGRCAGVYNVIVTDSEGCTNSKTHNIRFIGYLRVSLRSKGTSCDGACDGTISTFISGRNPPYTYQWVGPGGFTATTENITGRCAGEYNVIVTDSKGCTDSETSIVDPSPVFAFILDSRYPSCHGGMDGSLDIVVLGGSPPYTYQWSGPNGYSASTQDLSGIPAGEYTVLVTDSEACTKSLTKTIGEPPPLIARIQANPASSAASCNGWAYIVASGGTPPYTISGQVYGLCPGIYTVDITDANGCMITVGFEIGNMAGFTGNGDELKLSPNMSLGLRAGSIDSVIVDNLASIEENKLEASIKMFPNPSSGIVQLEFSLHSSEEVSIKVYDFTGRLMLERMETDVSRQIIPLDLSWCGDGLYSIKIQIDDSFVVEKLIKHH